MKNQLMTTTQAVDPVFTFLFGSCLVLLIGITAAMVWFVYRYHRSRSPRPTSDVHANFWLEMVWTVLPTLLVLGMFYYGWSGYLTLRDVPKGALQITAVARMWSWDFIYQNGKKSSKMYVPVGTPVQVNLESVDVLHAFYMPAFKIKRDAVPGMKNHVWFVATEPGSYDIFCSEYCGTGHAAMITTAEAVSPEQFAAWLQQATSGAAAQGEALLAKHGCLGCHSLDGTKKIGPTFKGVFGRKVKVERRGKDEFVTADEAYLRESILDPSANIVEDFPPVMPPAKLPEAELQAIIEYLKGLK
uniref:Cytochrome c oxidase subunit 2 n=1 Tax=Geobacter sp. (strain M21) TaxID=443144 RepID=C6E7U9_GEOSM